MHGRSNLELLEAMQAVIHQADYTLCTIQNSIVGVNHSLFSHEVEHQLKAARASLKEASDYQAMIRRSIT